MDHFDNDRSINTFIARDGLYFSNGTWFACFYDAGGSGAIYINPSISINSPQYLNVISRVDAIVNELINTSSYGVKQVYNASQLREMGGFEGNLNSLSSTLFD